MKYLGKKQLYDFAKERGFSLPLMKNMEYGFYRGDEWLHTCLEEIDVDVFCVHCCIIFISVSQYYVE